MEKIMDSKTRDSINKIKENYDFSRYLNTLKINLNLFLQKMGIKDLETFGFELKDVSKDKSFELELPKFGHGNTDLMILVKDKLDKKYNLINIELIPTDDDLEILTSAGSYAQLIAANTASDYPVLHITTNLREFEIGFLSKVDKKGHNCIRFKFKRDSAIPTIVYWLNTFYAKKNLKLLEDLFRDQYYFIGIHEAQTSIKEIAKIQREITLLGQRKTKTKY